MSAEDKPAVAVLMGMPPAVRSAIVWALTDEGFPRDQAEPWADGWACRPDPAFVVHQVVAFDDHGIPIGQAIEWHQNGFVASDACCFYDAGYNPSQAGTVVDLAQTDDAVDDWLSSGLPAERVLAYLRANVHVDETPAFEAHADGPTEMLMMLAGLRP